ncbi:MAG: hypothetical protein LBS74_05320 [Oscillospiraceae bacterium]|jgi:glutamate synthase domain-containing protein 3|nr:hypothetical protein [Oscillospiraceae bacterium]
MILTAKGIHYKELNEQIKEALAYNKEITLEKVEGQRYLGAAMDKGKTLLIKGTPGNDMACYMNGGRIVVFGNGQDGTANTMGGGEIVIHGRCGDAVGYGMRDGEVYIRDDVGWRSGIHMKEYGAAKPVLIIGGCAGAYLGEYMAGGVIILLGEGAGKEGPIGDYCGTGMHGGVIYIRGRYDTNKVSKEVEAVPCTAADMELIRGYVSRYCEYFGANYEAAMAVEFTKLKPVSSRPYEKLYVKN